MYVEKNSSGPIYLSILYTVESTNGECHVLLQRSMYMRLVRLVTVDSRRPKINTNVVSTLLSGINPMPNEVHTCCFKASVKLLSSNPNPAGFFAA